jgi:cysteinyl-tRNA synthetase
MDRGYHPLAYRMMCLQAHYRSELEFTWEGLTAALTRLKRIVMQIEALKAIHAEPGSASIAQSEPWKSAEGWTLKQVQGDEELMQNQRVNLESFDEAMSNDLATPEALTDLEAVLSAKKQASAVKLKAVSALDSVLGLNLLDLSRENLRIQPEDAQITEAEIEDALARRKAARTEKDFATSDAIRGELAAKGVEVMDGDPLGWEWRLG